VIGPASRVAVGAWAALALAGTLVGGCGSGGGGGLQAYFSALEEANDLFALEGVDAGQREYDSIEQFMTEQFIPVYREYVRALDELEAPAEVAEEHEELAAAHRELLELFEGSTERFAELETQEELGAFFEEPDVAALDAAVVERCGALAAIAEEREVEFDGQC
jgi:hypothetical protein